MTCEITLNFQSMELKFRSKDTNVILRGISDGGLCILSLECMERLFKHDQVEWTAKCIIMPTIPEEEKRSYPPDIQAFPSKARFSVAFLQVGMLLGALSM